ncbi:MAG: lysylphosphatidylglycerol synthase transmembrane domain-containing protein [Solirubrobacteraceae bacterium]
MATTDRRRHKHDSETGSPPDQLSSGHLIRRLLMLVVLLAIVAILVVSLPGLGGLRHRFGQADWRLLVVIALLKLCSCLSNIVAFRDVFCPKLGWRFSYRLGMAEQATNVLVPTGGAGGLALGAWALHQEGMPTGKIARRSVCFFVLTSLPNFACAMVLAPLLLTGLFHGTIPAVPTIVFGVLSWTVAVVIFMLPRILHRYGAAGDRRGGWAGKLRVAATSLEEGIRDVGELLRTRRWRAILGACGYLGFDIAALCVGFAAFGGGVPLGPLVLGYVVGQLGGLIPLPGGIGGTDGGLIGALVLYGAPLSTATAAVLAYRAFQLGVPAVLGTISFFGLRHTLAGIPRPSDRQALPADASDRPGEAVSARPEPSAGGPPDGQPPAATRDRAQ